MESFGKDSGIVVGALLVVWALRELLPLILKVRERVLSSRRPPPMPSPAEQSGAFSAVVPPEQIATHREVEELKAKLGELAVAVARLEARVDPLAKFVERRMGSS